MGQFCVRDVKTLKGTGPLGNVSVAFQTLNIKRGQGWKDTHRYTDMLFSVSQTKCAERRKTLTNQKSPLEGCILSRQKEIAAALSPTPLAKDTWSTLLTQYSKAPECTAAPKRLKCTREKRAAVRE